MSKTTSIQQFQFDGFLKTPELWIGESIFTIDQLELNPIAGVLNGECAATRLGMLAEQFLFQAIEQDKSNEVIARNLQIIDDKTTLGEFDALLNLHHQLVHLEIVYKFYLFDPKHSKDELECWIGPNRADSLVEKLSRLKENQFPLLYQQKSREVLGQLGYSPEEFEQKVNFKAQLFVPYGSEKKKYTFINNKCIAGVYFTRDQLEILKGFSFYIPTKLDWFVIPHPEVEWMNFEQFEVHLNEFLSKKMSPMCWHTDRSGELRKFFVVWW